MPSAMGWSASSFHDRGHDKQGGASPLLDDPVGMRRAGRELLSLALFDSRNHLLRLLALDETPAALRLAAQAGWYQEYWLARHVQRSRGEACDAQGLRLASIEPRSDDWQRDDAPPPEPALLRSYLADTLEVTLELLAALNDSTEDDVSLHFFRCSLMHEDRLGEALATRLPWRAAAGGPPARADRAALWQPAQRWQLGSSPGGLVPHNERWAHEVVVPEFEIDALPVSWARYVEFAEDGGYDSEAFWSAAGWAWVQQQGRRAPGVWSNCMAACWWRAAPGRRRACSAPAQPSRPCMSAASKPKPGAAGPAAACPPSLNGNWPPARVPAVVLSGAMSSSGWPAAHAPGRVPTPPAPGALDVAPQPGLGVLRGASFATRARWRHPKARRFAAPERDDLFCGFRSCAV